MKCKSWVNVTHSQSKEKWLIIWNLLKNLLVLLALLLELSIHVFQEIDDLESKSYMQMQKHHLLPAFSAAVEDTSQDAGRAERQRRDHELKIEKK